MPDRAYRNARGLRHHQTDAERKLWMSLRARQVDGVKFRRQHPIGPYIVDFCCIEQKLIVELDGGQHALRVKADQQRTDVLSKFGYNVLRIWDHELLNDHVAVLQRIANELNHPHPPLSLPGRGRDKRSLRITSSPTLRGRGQGEGQ